MNVFACHSDPTIAATWLADQHVVKMVTETAQILSTALRARGSNDWVLYRPTHTHHPCVVAAVENPLYFDWAAKHGVALSLEYTARFGKTHKAEVVVRRALDLNPPLNITVLPAASPLAMPEEFRSEDVPLSYQLYLAAKYAAWRDKGKLSAPRWRRDVPNNPLKET